MQLCVLFVSVLLGLVWHVSVSTLPDGAVVMWAENCFQRGGMAEAILRSVKEESPGLCIGICVHVSQISSYTELNFPGPNVFLQHSKR